MIKTLEELMDHEICNYKKDDNFYVNYFCSIIYPEKHGFKGVEEIIKKARQTAVKFKQTLFEGLTEEYQKIGEHKIIFKNNIKNLNISLGIEVRYENSNLGNKYFASCSAWISCYESGIGNT